MKQPIHFLARYKFIALVVVLFSVQLMRAQESNSSIKIHTQNFALSDDLRKITFDVYFQDVDDVYEIRSSGYTYRCKITQASIGTSPKTLSLSNQDPTLGGYNPTMTAQADGTWVLKFQSSNLIGTWATAKAFSPVYPGTKIATCTIINTDSARFNAQQEFVIQWVGTAPTVKCTVAVYKEGTQTLSSTSTTNMPASQFTGFGTYMLGTTDVVSPLHQADIFPTVTKKGFYVNAGNRSTTVSVYSLSGDLLMTQTATGKTYINISSFSAGTYVVTAGDKKVKVLKQ